MQQTGPLPAAGRRRRPSGARLARGAGAALRQIPVTESGATAILAMRTGENDAGVIGLRRTGLADEREPSLNVRFRGIDAKGILTYLVSAYYSAAVLVPDALGILENVEIAR